VSTVAGLRSFEAVSSRMDTPRGGGSPGIYAHSLVVLHQKRARESRLTPVTPRAARPTHPRLRVREILPFSRVTPMKKAKSQSYDGRPLFHLVGEACRDGQESVFASRTRGDAAITALLLTPVPGLPFCVRPGRGNHLGFRSPGPGCETLQSTTFSGRGVCPAGRSRLMRPLAIPMSRTPRRPG